MSTGAQLCSVRTRSVAMSWGSVAPNSALRFLLSASARRASSSPATARRWRRTW
jgi:hypothetical protein